MPDRNSAAGGDPFARFWTDMMGQMSGVGFTPPAASPEMMNQLRSTFFGVLARHAEEFMRSEQFLKAMKQSLDNALAFKQQLNHFLTQNLRSMNMATGSDSEHVALLVRGMEDRIVGKLEELSSRVEALEGHRNGSATETRATGPSGGQAKNKKKSRSKTR